MPQIIAGINGVNRQVKKIPLGVSGVNRGCKEAWAGVGGVNRKVYSRGIAVTVTGYRTDGPWLEGRLGPLEFSMEIPSSDQSSHLFFKFSEPLTFAGTGIDIRLIATYINTSYDASKDARWQFSTASSQYTPTVPGWSGSQGNSVGDHTFRFINKNVVLPAGVIFRASFSIYRYDTHTYYGKAQIKSGGIILYPLEYPNGLVFTYDDTENHGFGNNINFTTEFIIL